MSEEPTSLQDLMEQDLMAKESEITKLLYENERLREAIKQTIEENLHLADGEVCTLIHLKRALKEVEE